MEIVACALGVADLTATASSKLWALSEQWRSAPREIFELRDEVDRANAFFIMVRAHLQSSTNFGNGGSSGLNAQASEALRSLLLSGQGILCGLQDIIDQLLQSPSSKATLDQGQEEAGPSVAVKFGPDAISKRRRWTWLRNYSKFRQLKRSLHHNVEQIGIQLVFLNL